MSRYGFIISAVKSRLSDGKAAYAARMRHMDVIRRALGFARIRFVENHNSISQLP